MKRTNYYNNYKDSITILTQYNYDPQGRKTSTALTINKSTPVIIDSLQYNELGQLKTKKLHVNNNAALESIEYKYNARNWLTEAIAANFSFKLNYNEIASGVTPQYNGNISRQQWGDGATLNNSYIYMYDKMSRILNGKSNIGYDETIGEGNYDKVGNIKKIVRTGIIDNINFNYNGNRLVNVQGIINNTNINFKINYNANGSVVNDGKNNIAYNEINLPINIGSSGKYYFYTYNAKGEKLRRFANIIESRYYNDGIEYVNDTLKKIDIINIEDGLIKIKGNNINYLYFLKDHLGNTRVVLNANNGVNKMVQKINYYPFGKAHTKVADTINRYLYNGKEMQDSSGFYDYGAGYYNPNIGRFLTIDRYAEKYYMLTPYQYAANNPIKYIDVNGDSIGPTNNLTKDQMNTMTQFAATKAGNKFLSNYAKAGQQVFGQTFNKTGKFDKKGINVNYQNRASLKTSSTDKPINNLHSGIDINVNIASKGFGFENTSDNTLLNLTKSISHESFLHVENFTKDYLDDGQLNYSNISDWAKVNNSSTNFDHWQTSYNYFQNPNNNSSFPSKAIQVIIEVSSKNNLNIDSRKIKQVIWNFEGSLININNKGIINWGN